MSDKDKKPRYPNWNDRPETRDQARPGSTVLDGDSFVRLADQFISLANKRGQKVEATDMQLVMMFAAARYGAHVGKNILDVDDHESYVDHLTKQYQDMLRTHMSDPTV